MSRLVLANLDFEEELRAAARRGGAAGAGGRSLTAAARRAAAAAGALLRAFCREGDRLWLLDPVAPGRLPELPGLPAPVVESGPPEGLAPASALLPWGEGPRAAALRERWRTAPAGAAGEAPGAGLDGPLHEAVWRLPAPAPEAAARAAHRGFCLELARELGCALPGARMVADPGELEAHLAAGGAWIGSAAGASRWVVKAPYSASGRERFLSLAGGAGAGELLRPAVRRRLERLFARHGALLFEPWVERTADFGCAALLAPAGLRPASRHRQEVDPRGAFRAIVLPVAAGSDLDPAAGGLRPEERTLLDRALEAAAARLRAAGYSGAFGLDAYRWRRPGGEEAFQPLGEINPRLTLGLAARCLLDRLAAGPAAENDPAAAAVAGAATARLSLGRQPPPGAALLLRPAPGGGPAAWLEPLPGT